MRGERARWSWDLGASLERQRDDRRNFENLEGERGPLELDQLETVTGLGVFAHVRARVAAGLQLMVALRWDRFTFEAEDRFTAGDPDDSGTRVRDAFDPSAGLVLDRGPWAALFANVATSLQTPTTTELVNRPSGAGGFNPDLEPARGVSVEAGVRGELGSRLRYELVGFRTWLEDELVAFDLPGIDRAFHRNAGSSRHQGVELRLDARPWDGVRVRLSHSRTVAEFGEYEVDGMDFAGRRVPGLAPERVEGVLGLERGPVFLELSGEWLDEIPVDDATRPARRATRCSSCAVSSMLSDWAHST